MILKPFLYILIFGFIVVPFVSCNKEGNSNSAITGDGDSAKYLIFGASNKLFFLDASTGFTKWIKQFGGTIQCAPAYKKGVIFFGCNDNKVYAVDTLGNVKWSTSVKGGFQGQYPILDQANLYICDDLGNLYCMDVLNGVLKWRKNAQKSIYSTTVYTSNKNTSSIALDDKYIYFQATLTNGTDSIMKLDKLSGTTLLSKKTFNQGLFLPPIVNGNYLLYTSGVNISCIDKNDFSSVWNLPLNGNQTVYSSGDGIAMFNVNNGILYAYESFYKKMFKINPATGQIIVSKIMDLDINSLLTTSNPASAFTFSCNHYPIFIRDYIIIPSSQSSLWNEFYNQTDFANSQFTNTFGSFANNIFYDGCIYYSGQVSNTGTPAPVIKTQVNFDYQTNPTVTLIQTNKWIVNPIANLSLMQAQKIIITVNDNMVRFSKKEN